MHHHETECMQEDWFLIFKIKVTARAHMIKSMTVSTISSEVVDWA